VTNFDDMVAERAFELISNFSRGTARESFLAEAMAFISREAGTKFAFCGQKIDGVLVETVSVCADGVVQENFSYPLHGSPCEVAIERDACSFKARVTEKFPSDQLLVDMEIEGYCGVRLRGSDGKPIGILATLDTKDLRDTDFIINLLSIFAPPISREIEHSINAKRLVEEQKRLSDFAEAASDWFWETDEMHRFRYVSDRLRESTGIAPAEIIGKSREELVREDGAIGDFTEHYATLARREPFKNFNFARVGPDGEIVHMQVSGKPVYSSDGKFTGYRGVASNVTARVKHEQALQESRKRFEDFAKIASDWFWEQDQDLRFTYVSASIENVAGIRPEVHYGLTRREMMGGDFDDEALTAHEKLLENREPFSEFRYRRMRPDGVVKHISISGTPVFRNDGTFAGYRGTGRDVTSLITAQEKLEDEKRRSEKANAAKTEFLGNVSHELRTPLNAIIGFSDGLRSGIFPADKAAECANAIHTSGQTLLSLVNDLLNVTAIESGERTLKLEEVSAQETIENCLTELTDRISEKSLRVEISTPEGAEAAFFADRRALHQIVSNLLTNAVKFCYPGGAIDLAVSRSGKYDVLSVSDSGIGIDIRDMDRLFDPFFQANVSTHTASEGSGLGLSIVKALVEAHSGDISIDSAPDEGTVVTVRLPVANTLQQSPG